MSSGWGPDRGHLGSLILDGSFVFRFCHFISNMSSLMAGLSPVGIGQ